MLSLDYFRGKKPDAVPSLAKATERLTRAQQAHGRDADDLAKARAVLGQAMLNEADGAAITKARQANSEAEAKASDSVLTLAAAEAVHKAAQEVAQRQAEKDKAAAIADLLDKRHATAEEIDAAIDALTVLVQKNHAFHIELMAMNPPPYVPMPSGMSNDYLLRILEFRLRWREGMTYSPFLTLAESRVSNYLHGAEAAGLPRKAA